MTDKLLALLTLPHTIQHKDPCLVPKLEFISVHICQPVSGAAFAGMIESRTEFRTTSNGSDAEQSVSPLKTLRFNHEKFSSSILSRLHDCAKKGLDIHDTTNINYVTVLL